jgi:hypothetical protein
MTHPDPDDLVRLALDLLPEGERRGLMAHLRSCPSCRAAYQAHLEALGALVPEMPVPASWEGELRERLCTRPLWERRRVLALGLSLGFVGALFLGGLGGLRWWAGISARRRFFDLAAEPGARLMPLLDPGGRQTGWALRTAQGEVLLLLKSPPPPGRVYQAWLILDGQRKSLGLSPTPLLEVGPLPEESLVGVSVEPPGGSPAPTTPSVGRTRI